MKSINVNLFNHKQFSAIANTVDIIADAIDQKRFELSLCKKYGISDAEVIIENTTEDVINQVESNPDQTLLLFVTEYMTRHFATVFLNCFSKKEASLRLIYRLSQYIFFSTNNKFLIFFGLIFCRLQNRVLRAMCRLIGVEFDLFILYEKRLINLRKIRKSVSLVMSTTEDALKNYPKFFNVPAITVPIVYEAKKNKRSNSAPKKLVFSGRLTDQRESQIDAINRALVGHSFTDNQFPVFLRNRPKLNCNTTEKIEYVESIFSTLDGKQKALIFDIYIPQSKFWKLSSPNRTLASLQCECIPVNYGRFSDHAINDVAFTVETSDDLEKLLSSTNIEIIDTLERRLASYAKAQKVRRLEFNHLLEETLSKF